MIVNSKSGLLVIVGNDEQRETFAQSKRLCGDVELQQQCAGAGSQVRYMASSAMPLLVQGRATDTAPSEQVAAGSLSSYNEQCATAQASNQV